MNEDAMTITDGSERGDTGYPDFLREESPDGTIVGSLLPDGNHIPLFDLDFDCRLYPSRTPGHFHFYIGKPISGFWYRQILDALRGAGIVQSAWANHLTGEDRQCFLRVPADGSELPDWAPKSRYLDPELKEDEA